MCCASHTSSLMCRVSTTPLCLGWRHGIQPMDCSRCGPCQGLDCNGARRLWSESGRATRMSKEHLPSKTHAHLASVYALMASGPVLDGPEVGHHAGITARRASDALKRLTVLGAVRKGAPQAMGWERPRRAGSDPNSTYCLSNEWGYAVGVAAGHRGVGTGLVDACGRFREHGSSAPECRVDEDLVVDDDYWRTLKAIGEQIVECVRRREAQLAELDGPTHVDVRSITVGLPGQITGIREPDAGQRRVATILTKFGRKPVAGDLGTVLAQLERDLPFDPRTIPIWLENDADCAAVGELHWGEGRGCRSLLVVKVSAGIGAGVIVDGSIHYGHQATTGEIGHDRVHPAFIEYLNRDLPDGLEPLEPDSQILGVRVRWRTRVISRPTRRLRP